MLVLTTWLHQQTIRTPLALSEMCYSNLSPKYPPGLPTTSAPHYLNRCTIFGTAIGIDTDAAGPLATHHLVIEWPVWAIEQLADEVRALNAAALHIRQAVAHRGLAPDVEVVQLQQQLPTDGQRPVIAPHRNLRAAQRFRSGTADR